LWNIPDQISRKRGGYQGNQPYNKSRGNPAYRDSRYNSQPYDNRRSDRRDNYPPRDRDDRDRDRGRDYPPRDRDYPSRERDREYYPLHDRQPLREPTAARPDNFTPSSRYEDIAPQSKSRSSTNLPKSGMALVIRLHLFCYHIIVLHSDK
jgi:hypothetical protein